MYPGTAGAFEESYSEPIKVTIDPQEVILKPTEESVGKLKLNTSMTTEDIERALSKVKAEFYDANKTKVDVPVTDDFYGVSYDMQDAEQYYNPVFKIMYTEKAKNPSGDAAADSAKESSLREVDYDSNGHIKVRKSDKFDYTYYIAFSGDKAVYSPNGDLGKQIPVTEATDAANRNYKILTDEDILLDAANAVEVKVDDAVKTAVNVDAIIKVFTGRHADNTGDSIGKVLNIPAHMVYNPGNGLFAEKGNYKVAKVTKINEDNSVGDDVKTSDKDLTYTWEQGDWETYKTSIYSGDVNGQGENLEAWIKELENNVFDPDYISSSSSIPQDAGIYRLHVEYKDSSLDPEYAPSDGYVYFLIEKQQLAFKADDQYAEYDADVWDFTQRGYSLYEIPGNDEDRLNPETDKPLDWNADELIEHYGGWRAVNKAKNTDGQDRNPVEWEESKGKFRKDVPYDYRAAIWFDEDPSGTICKKDTDEPYGKDSAGYYLDWQNYTTSYWDAAADGGKGTWYHRFIVELDYAKILFVDRKEVVVAIDKNPFEDKIYDGEPIAEEATSVTLKDKTGTDISNLRVCESLDAEDAVKVGWYWTEGGKVVPTNEAKYAGTYKLVVSFEGNESYKAIGDYEGEWVSILDKNGQECTFEITPLEVVITPKLKDKATAGEPLSSMLGDGDVEIEVEPVYASHPIPEGDKWLFERVAGRVENAINSKQSIDVTTGYPIFGGGKFSSATYYVDNVKRTNSNAGSSELIRYGKEYAVELKPKTLFAQYAYSYTPLYRRMTRIMKEEWKC